MGLARGHVHPVVSPPPKPVQHRDLVTPRPEARRRPAGRWTRGHGSGAGTSAVGQHRRCWPIRCPIRPSPRNGVRAAGRRSGCPQGGQRDRSPPLPLRGPVGHDGPRPLRPPPGRTSGRSEVRQTTDGRQVRDPRSGVCRDVLAGGRGVARRTSQVGGPGREHVAPGPSGCLAGRASSAPGPPVGCPQHGARRGNGAGRVTTAPSAVSPDRPEWVLLGGDDGTRHRIDGRCPGPSRGTAGAEVSSTRAQSGPRRSTGRGVPRASATLVRSPTGPGQADVPESVPEGDGRRFGGGRVLGRASRRSSAGRWPAATPRRRASWRLEQRDPGCGVT